MFILVDNSKSWLFFIILNEHNLPEKSSLSGALGPQDRVDRHLVAKSSLWQSQGVQLQVGEILAAMSQVLPWSWVSLHPAFKKRLKLRCCRILGKKNKRE